MNEVADAWLSRGRTARNVGGITNRRPDDVWEGLAEALGHSGGPAAVDEVVDQHSSDLTALLGRWIMTLLP